jgi:hypothetical protein
MRHPLTLPELETLILDYHTANGVWPTRRALKVESTLRQLGVQYPELIQKLGGPPVRETPKQVELTEAQRSLVQYLPTVEREMVDAYFDRKLKQQDIAKLHCMTQPGVSYRLGRAVKRLKFLEHYPFMVGSEIQDALIQAEFNPTEAEALAIICLTTCQSSAARVLGWSQGKVRHHHWRAIERIKTMQPSEDTTLGKILKALEMVRDNPVILHEYPGGNGHDPKRS